MSWDVLIQDLPAVDRVDQIPDDFSPQPLGLRVDVIAAILGLIPTVDFSDSSWGVLTEEDFSIEFNIGSEDSCGSLMLHVRGGGKAMIVIANLLESMELKAIDCQTGEFFSLEAADDSFSEWRDYRDHVIESGEA